MRLSVSGGVAGFPEAPVGTLEELIDRADRALYEAKAAGRNQVVIFRRPSETESPTGAEQERP